MPFEDFEGACSHGERVITAAADGAHTNGSTSQPAPSVAPIRPSRPDSWSLDVLDRVE